MFFLVLLTILYLLLHEISLCLAWDGPFIHGQVIYETTDASLYYDNSRITHAHTAVPTHLVYVATQALSRCVFLFLPFITFG